MKEKIYQKFIEAADIYKLKQLDKDILWAIIKPICEHEEFLKRCEEPYYHHDDYMLGDHILRDTVVTYKMISDLNKKNITGINLEVACCIAMFHDLYEYPWQNSTLKKKLFNKHGFVHPIEATINAITWFPEYFASDDTANIIIDGIIHHMYPFPVRAFDDTEMYLNNETKFQAIPKKYQDMIINATKLGKIGKVSFRRSFYPEGRIVSKADKTVSFGFDLHSIDGLLAIFSGTNKKIKK